MGETVTFVAILLALTTASALSYRDPAADAAPSTEGDTSMGRLPVHLAPIHYSIELQPDIFTNSAPPFPFSGHVEIRFEVKQSTGHVYLNSYTHDVEDASVDLSVHPDTPVQADPPAWSGWELDEELEFFILHLDTNLTEGAHYVIKMDFNGTLRSSNNGMYWDSYIEDDQVKYVVSTQFQRAWAHYVFPCFDEPGLKATYDVTLVRKDTWTSLSNTEVISQDDRGDGWIADNFNTTVKMSAYLLCFTVCDYLHKETTSQNGHLVRVWARRDLIDQADYALSVAGGIQDWYENWTGIAYPLPKLDHIALPSKGGAMENWGLVTYGESALLYDPAVHQLDRQLRVARIIGHEVAHMWFGNWVTCKWWDDTWLNEAFASFFENTPLQEVANIPGYDVHLMGRVLPIMNSDSVNISLPVRIQVDTPWQAALAFTPFTYFKGSAIVKTLQQVLGEATFQRGIQHYLNRHAYGSATTDNLWTALTEQAAEDGITDGDGRALDMKLKMDPWVDQRGFPVVTVARLSAGTARLTQSQFLDPRDQDTPPSDFDYEWYVPVTSYHQDESAADTTTKDWLNRADKTISNGLPGDLAKWVSFNVKRNGFWRVQYDEQTKTQIANQLVNDPTVFDSLDRASFIDDSFKLARAGYQKEVDAMDFLKYLDKDDHYSPWSTTSTVLNYQSIVLHRFNTSSNLFKNYFRSRMDPPYSRLGWTDQEGDGNWEKSSRSLLQWLACTYGNPDCIQEASRRFSEFQADPANNKIAPDQRLTVYCAAIRAGTEDDWNLLYNRYNDTVADSLDEEHRFEKPHLISALACPSDETVLQKYLNHILDSTKIREWDANSAMIALADSQDGRQIVWDHLKNNWRDDPVPELSSKYTILLTVTGVFSTAEDQSDLAAFITQYPPEDELEEVTFDAATDTVAENKQWADDNEPELRSWFEAQPDEQPLFHRSSSAGGGGHGLREYLLRLDDVNALRAESVWYDQNQHNDNLSNI